MSSKPCPKSDEGVKAAVKQGALVAGLGKAAQPVAAKLREVLAHRCTAKGDNWEDSRVVHLIVVVELSATSGDCCDAATKFMRQVRASDGYSVYADIIGRKVAVLGLGRPGKVAGAAKVEEVLLKRGGCKRLLSAVGAVGALPADADVAALPWTRQVCDALDATMDPPPQPEAPLPAAPAPAPAVEPSSGAAKAPAPAVEPSSGAAKAPAPAVEPSSGAAKAAPAAAAAKGAALPEPAPSSGALAVCAAVVLLVGALALTKGVLIARSRRS